MSDDVERPTYYEGQVLAAADLNAGVDHARNRQARHDRYLHTWGIAEGLTLSAAARQTALDEPYVEVTVGAGLAIDGTGREVVVAEPVRLSEELFDQLNVAVADERAWYPVFLMGRDREVAAAGGLTAACTTGQPTRLAEAQELTFGGKGDELELDRQLTIEVDDGSGGGTGEEVWRVLLGFVQWNSGIQRFTAVADTVEGVGRLYAGVRADEVSARGGKLTLRSAARGQAGKPALLLDGTGDGALRFGLQDAGGAITPLLTVNANGDVTAAGKITSALTAGVHVASGIASDGVLLPLPAGITQEQVDRGQAVLHVHVTPRYQGQAPLPPPPVPNKWLLMPLECRAEGRRVFCRFRWTRSDFTNSVELPGVCDYTLTAYVAAGEESSP